MIDIEIQDHELRQALRELSGRLKNMSPLMRNIAGIMLDAVEENFEREGRPRWRPLAKSTIRQRTRQGKWPGKILQKSQGGLASSVSQKYDESTARVGTNKVYAAIHHFGGRAGRGHAADIPARPFMKLTSRDIGTIKQKVLDYLFRINKQTNLNTRRRRV